MFNILISIIIILSLQGCEKSFDDIAKEHGLVDEYPLIDESERVVYGVILSESEIYLEENDSLVPLMIKLSKDCSMMAEVSKFGNVSIQITPKRVSCQNPNIETELTALDISKAYINIRIKIPDKIPFQVYSSVRLI